MAFIQSRFTIFPPLFTLKASCIRCHFFLNLSCRCILFYFSITITCYSIVLFPTVTSISQRKYGLVHHLIPAFSLASLVPYCSTHRARPVGKSLQESKCICGVVAPEDYPSIILHKNPCHQHWAEWLWSTLLLPVGTWHLALCGAIIGRCCHIQLRLCVGDRVCHYIYIYCAFWSD